MSSPLDTGFIRASTPGDVAQYLRKVLAESSAEEVNHGLLQAVERGSLQPSVFVIWLGVSDSPLVTKQALEQNFSIGIRKYGIKRFQKHLKSTRWRQTWDDLGGTQGLLDLFSDFSVREVRDVCQAISFSSRGEGMKEKREKVTELLKALLPRLFPDAVHRNPDQRPLIKHYERLVPGCTPDFITEMLDNTLKGEWKHVRGQLLSEYHADTLRNFTLQAILNNYPDGRRWLSPLARNSPSATGLYPGFSASMQFSLQVLRRLVKEESSHLSGDDFIGDLVEPLMRRAIKKRVDWPRTQEIVNLAVSYLEKHPGPVKKLQHKRSSLLHFVASSWSRQPEMFEKQFGTLLSYGQKEKRDLDIDNFEGLMVGVAKSRRYALLRFCFKEVAKRDIDIQDDLKGAQGTLTSTLLQKLEAEQALDLLTRLRNARGDENLVAPGPDPDSITRIPSEPGGSRGDPDMFQIVLIQRHGDEKKAEQLAAKCVQERKKKAMSSSDQSERAFYAKSVLFYAIASGSLQLYSESLGWARRFVRDPLTIPVLYQSYPYEAKDLLCSIPEKTAKDLSPSTVRARVKAANEILLGLFETACLALREPSFAADQWYGTLRLYFSVTRKRIKQTSGWQTTLGLSDEDVYSSVWEDTVRLLVTVEEEALKSGHERLIANSIRGILNYGTFTNFELKDASPPTYRFFDNLAKARDQLWCKFRPTVHPSAATLPDPYPRGLPVQHLTDPYIISTPSLHYYAPYLAARANSAVYLDPNTALKPFPTEDDMQAAIGCFIDDYHFALQILIPKSLDQAEKKKRVDRAWTHAVGPLSEPRMSPEEAVRYWNVRTEDGFVKFWPREDALDPNLEEYLIVPRVDDPTEVEEWNPMPPQKEEIKLRTLDELTYVDFSKAMKDRPSKYVTVHSEIWELAPGIPGKKFKENNTWSPARNETAKQRPAMREGQILSALLYLDTLNLAKTRILSSPFPSTEDVRYPSVYLDEQFLSRGDPSASSALVALQTHILTVPPTLLAQLTQNTMNALNLMKPGENEYVSLERMAFQLVELLAKSDRPRLTSEIIVRTIIQHPDASSWHRRLLSAGFLRTLSASDARACFTAFAIAIITTLDEQAKTKQAAEAEVEEIEKSGKSSGAPEKAQQQPFIKVTTVKFLAQLLRDTEFVSEDFSLSVLVTILQKTSHLDIQTAVVDSLLNMLRSSPAELSEKILIVLESIVSIASNLNERRPISEADWAKAEESLELPEIEADSFADSSPMLNALLDFLKYQPKDFEHRGAYTQRIILPTIEKLKQQTKRWIRIFLLQYDIEEEAQELLKIPMVPRSMEIWKRLLRAGSSHLPFSVLEEYVAHITFNVAPPSIIKELNEKVYDDPALRSQAPVKFWLSLYSNGLRVLNIGTRLPLVSLLTTPSSLTEDVGITTKKVQEIFLRQFTAVLWNDNPHYIYVKVLTNQLRPQNFDENWLKYQKPIVEAIILYVKSLRTREWERDANREPKVLPDTYPLQLWLLQYPRSQPKDVDQEKKCKEFADQLSRQVDQVSTRLYHSKLAQIKETLGYVSETDCPLVAIFLGDITKTRLSWLTIHDQLRVELAAYLIGRSKCVEDAGLKRRVEDMLESWKACESEEVRRFGYTTKWADYPGTFNRFPGRGGRGGRRARGIR